MALTTTDAPADQLVGRSTLTALARVEARRLARNPVLILGFLVLLVQETSLLWDIPANRWANDAYSRMASSSFLIAATFIVAALAAMRDREDTTAETFRAVAPTERDRTVALLLAGLVPVALAAAVSLYVAVLVVRAGGIPVGEGRGLGLFRLSPAEIAHPVVQTAAAFAAGVATARIVRSRAVGVVVGVLGSFFLVEGFWLWSWFPAAFLTPDALAPRLTQDLGAFPSREVLQQTPLLDLPDSYDPDFYAVQMEVGRVGWHALFLVGMTMLFAGLALTRSSGTRWHPLRLVIVGGVVAALGFTMQLWATHQSFAWFESVG